MDGRNEETRHELGLIAFRLALRSRGWRMSHERVQPMVAALTGLARRHRVALGGPAAGDGALDASGILALSGDPIAEAARITALVESGMPK
jgi:hypothetical protein